MKITKSLKLSIVISDEDSIKRCLAVCADDSITYPYVFMKGIEAIEKELLTNK